MSHLPLTVWFALSAFACSALLFWLEPLVGKQLLPLLGGAPAVWNVCLLFFQTALLAGYAAAHGITRLSSRRVQLGLFGLLVLAACLTLPVEFAAAPAAGTRPVPWVFQQLSLEVGLPFLALAAAAPLLQHWATGARDPYVLYAASNAGSLTALLAFPVLIEPAWSLAAQRRGWAVAFVFVLILVAIAALLRQPVRAAADLDPDSAPAPKVRTQLTWLLLSAVPSSLLLGVTSFLTTDLAPVPLLWILPLALYLLTFIAAFSMLPEKVRRPVGPVTVVLAVVWVASYRLQAVEPLLLLLPLHLLTFTCAAFLCHDRLAALRPPRVALTRFYLLIALGGALGGAFNTLLAPLLFDSVIEYPLFLLGALLLGLYNSQFRRLTRNDVLLLAGLLLAMFVLLSIDGLRSQRVWTVVLAVGLPAAAAYLLRAHTLRFVLMLAAILVSVVADTGLTFRRITAERNFYGVLRVTTDARGRYHELRHGNTLHGAADLAQPGGSRPLSYYSYRSPGTDIVRSVQARRAALNVGIVGLGVGSMAWYARPQEKWTFFEINPAIVALAQDTTLFSFLQRSRAERIAVRLGDARLVLRDEPKGTFDLLVLDAFSSDAIPIHLLTREAVQLFLDKLSADGVLAFHISNRYLDLAPVLADLARAFGLRIRARADLSPSLTERAFRIEASQWVAIARKDEDFGEILFGGTWYEPKASARRVWSDDYTNLWRALVW